MRLASRSLPVILLDRNDISGRQLTLVDNDHQTTRIFPQCRAGHTGPIQQLLVTTKTPATDDALLPLLPDLVPGATVVLLQNGMGTEDSIRARRPDLQLLVAVTTDGVFRPSRDTLVLAGHGDTLIGSLAPRQEALTQWAAATLGMRAAPDIQVRRWLKLAMNCAINPLTALRHCRNGELLNAPDALATMRAVCDEVAAVMRAEGLDADGANLYRLACETAGKTGANVSSMRADTEAGRETEIRQMNGFVVARARALGIPAPVNARLLSAIEAIAPVRVAITPSPH